jgi:hypothetical protein
MPTPYTSDTFKQYLLTSLGDTAVFFEWDISTPALDEVVNDVLFALDIDDLAAATSYRKLRATGQYYVIQTALRHALTLYNFSVNGRSFDRGKIVDNLKAMLTIVKADPNVVINDDEDSEAFLISTTKISFTDDPYGTTRDPSFGLRPKDE